MTDPHANFKAEVACYTAADPTPTLEKLSELTGIPVDKLTRYILVKYAASASDALLTMPPIVFGQMQDLIAKAEGLGTEAARLHAYEGLKQIVAWLSAAAANPESPHPGSPHSDSPG